MSYLFCVKAAHTDRAGKRDIAWSYVCDAERWCGALSAIWAVVRAGKHHSKSYSCNGKKGAKKRHKGNREVRAHAMALYKQRHYPSANKAAYALMAEILKVAKEKGVPLSEENAQRTIAGWFRNHQKSPSSG
jgi:hypothetical protein